MKKIALSFTIFLSSLTFLTSCGESNNSDSTSSDNESNLTTPTYGSLTDPRDNHTYKTVVINGDTWMSENLNVTHFRNGDEIPQVQNDGSWYDLRTPAWCYYNNDPKSEALYGKLYNWYAISDERGLAPEGWHVPSKEDWEKLINKDWNNVGRKLKDPKNWNKSKYNAKMPSENNITGFNGYPGGWRHKSGGFNEEGKIGKWWSSEPIFGYSLDLNDRVTVFSCDARLAFSVRCVKGSDGFKVSVKETAPEEEEMQVIPQEEESQVNVEYYKINDPDGYSNLRDVPKGEVLQKVYDTEKFEVIDTEGDYKKVKLSTGVIGYIHKSRVAKL